MKKEPDCQKELEPAGPFVLILPFAQSYLRDTTANNEPTTFVPRMAKNVI